MRRIPSVRLRGGMYLSLSSPAEINRAKRLVQKNPYKYEVSDLWPSGDPAPEPQLYFWAHPEPEGAFIQAWIETGQGSEPS